MPFLLEVGTNFGDDMIVLNFAASLGWFRLGRCWRRSDRVRAVYGSSRRLVCICIGRVVGIYMVVLHCNCAATQCRIADAFAYKTIRMLAVERLIRDMINL